MAFLSHYLFTIAFESSLLLPQLRFILTCGPLLSCISPSRCITANCAIAEELGEPVLLIRVLSQLSLRQRQDQLLVRSKDGLLGDCCVRVESLDLKGLY